MSEGSAAVLLLGTTPPDPLEILHIVAFVTLCEAYMGIGPHIDQWNYFHGQLLQGLGTEAVVLGHVGIYVKSRHGVDSYFHLSMSECMDGWWKVWFFLRNDTDTMLPMLTGSHPIPQSNWGYGLVGKDICILQLLCEVVQQLLHVGLTGVDLF
jgi:hypothetical protein